jgi:hypothetical protein
MTKRILFLSIGLLSLNASAQIGQRITEFDKLMGAPVKDHKTASPPTKIFIKNSIQAQISYENGIATAGVYHVAMIANGVKQPISDAQLKMIYAWNGIEQGDLVAANFKEYPQLDGMYQKTKDGKLLILHDKKKNILGVLESKSFLEQIERLKKQ